MDVAVLRCQSCMAPIDLQQGPVQHCTYCGAALVVRAGGSPAAALAAIPQELRLLDAGRNKIGVIKVIREHTGLGLVEAKDLAEKVPAVVARWDDATRIEAFRAALVAAGARVG